MNKKTRKTNSMILPILKWMTSRFCTILFYACLIFNAVAQQKLQFTEEEKQWIKSHPQLKFGYDPQWPPYDIYQNGAYKGIVNEYLEIISKQTGIKLIPTKGFNLTLGKQIIRLKNKEIDFISDLAITEKRKKSLLFTDIMASEALIIATRKDFNLNGGLSKLSGKKVAIPFNYYTIELLTRDYPEIKIIQMASSKECMMALSIGEVDAVVEILGVVSYNINHFGFENIQISAPTEYKNIELAIAMDTSSKILHTIINKVMRDIPEITHNKIRQKWIAVTYDHKNDYRELIKFLKIFGAIALGIALLLYLWTLSLRKHIREKVASEAKLKESLVYISKQNEERKFLLQEIHHRVKNNLQIISSLLKLQANNNLKKNESFNLDATIDRIRAIGLIHEKIYQSPNLNQTNLNDYLSSLVNTILSNYANKEKIKTKFDIDAIKIHTENIVPVAIIINELVTNTIKHGIRENEQTVIELSFKAVGTDYILRYTDNGKWIPNQSQLNFGESLIAIFTSQLNGTYVLETTDKTVYTITLPNRIQDEL